MCFRCCRQRLHGHVEAKRTHLGTDSNGVIPPTSIHRCAMSCRATGGRNRQQEGNHTKLLIHRLAPQKPFSPFATLFELFPFLASHLDLSSSLSPRTNTQTHTPNARVPLLIVDFIGRIQHQPTTTAPPLTLPPTPTPYKERLRKTQAHK